MLAGHFESSLSFRDIRRCALAICVLFRSDHADLPSVLDRHADTEERRRSQADGAMEAEDYQCSLHGRIKDKPLHSGVPLDRGERGTRYAFFLMLLSLK